ncbi:hypothetical protein [Brevundimonas sp.]|uniref:hypothetical protein n=1 Tax=Brevundimonas sp. TaxID=1871086 RepID=UPI002D6361BD|nr:hypothetical protein [Brevundimonas sp.]HYC98456.1 hypothetical protein [Brevundimonas sp.]
MTKLARHWAPGLLGLCALVTLLLLVWPAAAARPAAAPAAERYLGPDHQTRRGGPMTGFAIRLGSTDALSDAPAPAAVPALVGLAGRRAWLRSAATGEVEGVAVGQTLDGWRLVAVTTRTVTLRGPEGDRRLEVFAAGPPPTPAPGAGTMAAPAAPVPSPEGG